jgi:hypothetical protein
MPYKIAYYDANASGAVLTRDIVKARLRKTAMKDSSAAEHRIRFADPMKPSRVLPVAVSDAPAGTGHPQRVFGDN